MAENNFIGAASHAELHERFICKIAGFLEKLKESGSFSAEDLLSFLKGWLIDHLMREDSKLRVLSKSNP